MSWTLYGVQFEHGGVLEAVEKTIEAQAVYADEFEKPEVKHQIEAAVEMISGLVNSGCLGDEGPYTATLYGHANPGHETRAGYANDVLTVTVQRLGPEAQMTTTTASGGQVEVMWEGTGEG